MLSREFVLDWSRYGGLARCAWRETRVMTRETFAHCRGLRRCGRAVGTMQELSARAQQCESRPGSQKVELVHVRYAIAFHTHLFSNATISLPSFGFPRVPELQQGCTRVRVSSDDVALATCDTRMRVCGYQHSGSWDGVDGRSQMAQR